MRSRKSDVIESVTLVIMNVTVCCPFVATTLHDAEALGVKPELGIDRLLPQRTSSTYRKTFASWFTNVLVVAMALIDKVMIFSACRSVVRGGPAQLDS